MKRVVIGIIFIISIIIHSGAIAWADDSISSMSRLSREFLDAVKDREWIEARKHLMQLSTKFSQQNWQDIDISVEGIHALSEGLVKAKRSVAEADPDMQRTMTHAIQLRLMFDSLEGREQPLWHNYYHVLSEDIDILLQAVESGNKETIVNAVNRLNAHYKLIEPVLYVTRVPQVVERMSALNTYLNNEVERMGMNREPLLNAIEKWNELLDPLFFGADEEVLAIGTIPSPPVTMFIWLLFILIGTVLTYVAWKKAHAIYTYKK